MRLVSLFRIGPDENSSSLSGFGQKLKGWLPFFPGPKKDSQPPKREEPPVAKTTSIYDTLDPDADPDADPATGDSRGIYADAMGPERRGDEGVRLAAKIQEFKHRTHVDWKKEASRAILLEERKLTCAA